MKANINITKGETTLQYINRITEDYLSKHDRVVAIEEVRQFFLAQANATVSNMAESAFTKMVEKQVIDHAMKHM